MTPFQQLIVTAVIAFLLPLIPAILIFRLFPDTKVSVYIPAVEGAGPLADMSVRTTGAFAAYFVLLIALWLIMVRPIYEDIQRVELAEQQRLQQRHVWTISGVIGFVNQDGKEIKSLPNKTNDKEEIDEVVEFDTFPKEYQYGSHKIEVTVPADVNGTLPTVIIIVKEVDDKGKTKIWGKNTITLKPNSKEAYTGETTDSRQLLKSEVKNDLITILDPIKIWQKQPFQIDPSLSR